jgi:hypothetical protein
MDYEGSSTIVYLILLTPCVAWASYKVVEQYAESDTPMYARISLYIGFFTTFEVVLLLPVDIGCTLVLRAEEIRPINHYLRDRKAFLDLYENLYMVILFWGNVVMYYLEYYNTDGYFTTGARAASALKRLAIDYVPFIIGGGIGLGALLGLKVCPPTSEGLSTFSKIATNAGYEVFLMFLMGFGLVEFPRLMWAYGTPQKLLQKQQIKAATEFATMMDCQMGLAKHVADALKTKERLGTNDPMVQEAMSIIISECPTEFRSSKIGELAADKDGNVTIDSLSALRTKMNTAKSIYRMAQARLEHCQMGAYNLEDICEAEKANAKTIFWKLKNQEGTPEETRWLLKTRPKLYRVFAVFLSVASLFCFLGVIGCMSDKSIGASVYFQMLHGDAAPSLGGYTMAVYLQMIYPILVTSWALFQLRSLGLELVEHRTTPNALSFGCRLIMGLSFPLCFFYLSWVAENGINDGPWMHVPVPVMVPSNVTDASGNMIFIADVENFFMPPAFAEFYPLASIPFIKGSFNSIYPLLLFLFLFLILSQAWNRLMVMVKMPNMQFGDPIVSEEQLAEGMKQLARFKKIAERTVQRKELTKRRMNKGADEIEDPGLKVCGVWIRKPKLKEKQKRSSLIEQGGRVKFPPPASLGGGARLKLRNGRMKLVWRDMYLVVKQPGVLYFVDDEAAAEKDQPTPGKDMPSPLPLTIVMDFLVPLSAKQKDGYRLLLHTHEDTIKVRFESEEEAFYWKKRLLEWKDYAVLLDNLGENRKSPEKSAEQDEEDAELLGDIEMGGMTENPMVKSKGDKGKGGADEEAKDGSAVGDTQAQAITSSEMGADGIPVNTDNFNALADKLKKTNTLTPEQKKDQRAQALRMARLHRDTDVDATEAPPPLHGWLLKKRANQMYFDNMKYQRRYFRVDADTLNLSYYISDFDGEAPRDKVDLKTVESIALFDKSGKLDDCRFNVVCENFHRVLKLKAETPKEAKHWIDGLNRWRDYLLIRYGQHQHASVITSPQAAKRKMQQMQKRNLSSTGVDVGDSQEETTDTTLSSSLSAASSAGDDAAELRSSKDSESASGGVGTPHTLGSPASTQGGTPDGVESEEGHGLASHDDLTSVKTKLFESEPSTSSSSSSTISLPLPLGSSEISGESGAVNSDSDVPSQVETAPAASGDPIDPSIQTGENKV